jgi:hypothetical protein
VGFTTDIAERGHTAPKDPGCPGRVNCHCGKSRRAMIWTSNSGGPTSTLSCARAFLMVAVAAWAAACGATASTPATTHSPATPLTALATATAPTGCGQRPYPRSNQTRLVPKFVSTVVATAPSGITPTISGTTASPATLTPEPGTLETGIKVDVGGYALFVRCTGQGSPPAVFDAGANNGSSTWSAVEPKVATFTTTCVYDRANLGRSDRGPVPNTSQQIVHDLHTLLGKVQIAGPSCWWATPSAA